MVKVGLTENTDDDSEDNPFDERKKTSLQHLKKGSKRVDTIPVTSMMNNSKQAEAEVVPSSSLVEDEVEV